jgi:hypothetical protein
MCPARGFPDRPGMTPSQIELVIPVIGVSLQDARIPCLGTICFSMKLQQASHMIYWRQSDDLPHRGAV